MDAQPRQRSVVEPERPRAAGWKVVGADGTRPVEPIRSRPAGTLIVGPTSGYWVYDLHRFETTDLKRLTALPHPSDLGLTGEPAVWWDYGEYRVLVTVRQADPADLAYYEAEQRSRLAAAPAL